MEEINLVLPPTWTEIIRRVQAAAPQGRAYLGGGALRDLYHGLPHKDLDIFVESRRDLGSFTKTLERLKYRLGTPARSLCHPEYLEWQEEVTGFANWDILGQDVQVVGVDYRPFTARSCAARHDFGICQIVSDGRDVWVTPEFLTDSRNRQFTVVREDTEHDKQRTAARYDRLVQKYPGWALVR